MLEIKVQMKILLYARRPKGPTDVGDDTARGFHRSAHQLDYLQLVLACVSQLKSLVVSRRWLLSLLTLV
jgi:hypothetical protein